MIPFRLFIFWLREVILVNFIKGVRVNVFLPSVRGNLSGALGLVDSVFAVHAGS